MSGSASRRINQLLERFVSPSYLEIGVFKGGTFLDVKATRKVAVDPKFQFELPHPSVGAESSLHEMTSDAYFAALPVDTVFDIVFLDGLHLFEQTLRDFCNTLAHTHRESIIVIDDTIPCDPYSALRDQGRAIRDRKAHGVGTREWHGDTFKVVLAIHDLFPAYSYATVMGDGNPQTVVWRQSRRAAPWFPDLQTIGQLDYFGFRDSLGLFNTVSQSELHGRLPAVSARTPGSSPGASDHPQ